MPLPEPPPLTVEQILRWADALRRRTGSWPGLHSGPIPDAGGDTWAAVDAALRHGFRGLPGGGSLARLLADRRAPRGGKRPGRLTLKKVRAWAEAHLGRSGLWPDRRSEDVAEAPGETWEAIEEALRRGLRGLRGGSSLERLLAERGPSPEGS
jgi:hypothetical protein